MSRLGQTKENRPILATIAIVASHHYPDDHRFAPLEEPAVLLEKNKRILTSSQGSHGAYDLVLICNGANSTLRSQLPIKQSVKTYPWGALWFIGKRSPEFSPNQLWQVVEETDVLNGFLPTGTSEDLLSLFYSIPLS